MIFIYDKYVLFFFQTCKPYSLLIKEEKNVGKVLHLHFRVRNLILIKGENGDNFQWAIREKVAF